MRITTIRRAAAGGALALAAAAGLTVLTSGPAFAATSQVSVVHGIPGQPVDVYVNGEKTLENFQPGDVAGPLSLEEGDYDIALTKPGEAIGQALLTVNDAAVPLRRASAMSSANCRSMKARAGSNPPSR